MHREAKETAMLEFGAEKGLLRVQARRMSGSHSKTPNSMKGFSKSFLKVRCGSGALQGVWSARAQFSDWLMVKEQSGEHYQSLGASRSGGL